MADLVGARFVTAVEVENGQRMAEVLIKQLTGGDRIRARKMRQDHFEFPPTHKIFLAANHKPVIKGTDHAIWRRIRLIPFTVTISDHEKDTHLETKLKTEELPGILAWAVRGCLAWQQDGLQAPADVAAATSEYRQEMDPLAKFIAERCIEGPKCKAVKTRLFLEYTTWCQMTHERALSGSEFGVRLTEKGFDGKGRSTGGNYVWRGIGLRSDKEDQLQVAA
jgi:putative DNA primase/helicase